MLHARWSFVVALLTASIGTQGFAQSDCYVPDNLEGSCCAQVSQPDIHDFLLPRSLPALGICFDHCSEPDTHDFSMSFGETIYAGCNMFTVDVSVLDGATTILTGEIHGDYSRTWSEFGPSGKTQVWRYVLRVDLGVPDELDPAPCVVPTCITPGDPDTNAFFYGYLDFANCLDAQPAEDPIEVLMLYHNTDYFVHMGTLSQNPGVYHPALSYAIVAHSEPNMAQSNFSPAQVVAPEAPAPNYHPVYGAMRDFGNLQDCYAATPIIPSTAVVKIIDTGCSGGFKTLRECSTDNTACNSAAWHSLTYGFPSLPWFHLVSTSIGSWTAQSVYPGYSDVWADEGLFSHQEECGTKRLEVKYGASTENTEGGFEMVEPIEGITTFTDLVDNYSAPWLGPYPLPMVGVVQQSNHVIYVSPR